MMLQKTQTNNLNISGKFIKDLIQKIKAIKNKNYFIINNTLFSTDNLYIYYSSELVEYSPIAFSINVESFQLPCFKLLMDTIDDSSEYTIINNIIIEKSKDINNLELIEGYCIDNVAGDYTGAIIINNTFHNMDTTIFNFMNKLEADTIFNNPIFIDAFEQNETFIDIVTNKVSEGIKNVLINSQQGSILMSLYKSMFPYRKNDKVNLCIYPSDKYFYSIFNIIRKNITIKIYAKFISVI